MMRYKLFFFSLIFSSVLSMPTYADFENLVLDKTKQLEQELSLSPDFIAHIKDCTPAEDHKKYQGMNSSYIIKGLDNEGKCHIISTGDVNNLIITSSCKFDNIVLQMWHDALIGLKQTIKNAKSIQEIMSSSDYLIASSIFLDEENCQISNQEFDPSKELRKHLKDCTPYNHKEHIEISHTTIEYTIIGEQDGKCLFQQKVTQNAPSANDMQNLLGNENYEQIKTLLRDTVILTDCKFSDPIKEKYISLLAQTALPAGSITSQEQMFIDRQPYQNATNFLATTPQCHTQIQQP